METVGGWNLILRDGATTLSPDPGGAVVFTFDREGRPIAWSPAHTWSSARAASVAARAS